MVTGRNHCGIASTGFSAPESEARGGFTKKAVNWACCADLLKVASTVPMPIPARMHNTPPSKTKGRLP